MKIWLIKISHHILSLIATLLLFVLGNYLAEGLGLPFLQYWALAHGMLFVIFPIYYLITYLLFNPIIRFVFKNQITQDNRHISLVAVLSVIISSIGWYIPYTASIIGIIIGHIARRQCKSDLQLRGSGIAIGGLIVGYLGLFYALYIFGVPNN